MKHPNHINIARIIFFFVCLSLFDLGCCYSQSNNSQPSNKSISTQCTLASPYATKVVESVNTLPIPSTTNPPDILFQVLGTLHTDIGLCLNDFTINTSQIPGSKLKKLLDSLICNEIMWSPDGQWLAFTGSFIPGDSSKHPEPLRLYVLRNDGTELHYLKGITFEPIYVTWSPDQKSLLFTGSDQTQSGIYLIDLDNSNLLELSKKQGVISMPSWSPDGNWIAYLYTTEPEKPLSYLWVMDKSGEKQFQLTNNKVTYTYPTWSMDNKKIAFTMLSLDNSQNPDPGKQYIFTTNLDGTNIEQLSKQPKDIMYMKWVQNDKYIEFIGKDDIDDSFCKLYLINVEDGAINVWQDGIICNASAVTISPVPTLEIGEHYVVTEFSAGHPMKTSVGIDSVTNHVLEVGEELEVVHGPIYYNGYFWLVRTENGIEGWVQDSYGGFFYK